MMPTEFHAIAVSSSDASTAAPVCFTWRRFKAARMPITAHIPVPKSTMDTPARTGPPSCSPVMSMIPENACISGS